MTRIEQLVGRAFSGADGASRDATYALIDGAREEGIYRAIADSGLEHASLYEGADDALREVAPYLVRLKPEAALTRRLVDGAWGQSWGVLVRTTAGFADLRRHFRTFLRVRSHDGRILYFRFYDPRVLREYLPTCNTDELKQVFGPVRHFLVEGQDGRTLITFELAVNFQGRLSLDVQTLALTTP